MSDGIISGEGNPRKLHLKREFRVKLAKLEELANSANSAESKKEIENQIKELKREYKLKIHDSKWTLFGSK